MAQLAAVAEAERENYERLKAELRTAAAALSLACFAACYYFYGRVRRTAEQRCCCSSLLEEHALIILAADSSSGLPMPLKYLNLTRNCKMSAGHLNARSAAPQLAVCTMR